jgi:hypothetical protein
MKKFTGFNCLFRRQIHRLSQTRSTLNANRGDVFSSTIKEQPIQSISRKRDLRDRGIRQQCGKFAWSYLDSGKRIQSFTDLRVFRLPNQQFSQLVYDRRRKRLIVNNKQNGLLLSAG